MKLSEKTVSRTNKKNKDKKNKDKKNKLKKNKPDSDSDEEDIYETEDSEEEEEEDEEDDQEDEDDDYDEDEDDEEEDTSDSSYHPRRKSSKSKYALRSRSRKSKVVDDHEDEDGDMDKHEFRKLLAKIFPSKYIQEKVENTVMEAIEDEDDEEDEEEEPRSKRKAKPVKPKGKSRRFVREEEEDEDEDEDEDDEDWEEDEDNGRCNIIFTIDGADDEDEYIDDDDAECDSDDEQAFMKETYEKVDVPEKVKPEPKKTVSKTKKTKEIDNTTDELTDVEQEYLELVETKKTLSTQLKKKPTSKILRNAVKECNTSIKKLVKKARTKNAKTYHELITGDRKRTNEIDYFKKKMSNKEQLRVMRDLKEINSHINIEKPYRLALLDSKMPAKFKAIAMQKLNVLRSMDPGDNEYYKIKNWVDTFMKIPFGKYQDLSVSMVDGIDKCHDFMEKAKAQLDDCAYGHTDAKLQIMQMMGQWISNPGAMGSAIAIKGPMGTGKTTLVKDGISKILGREFAFIALGGTGDASFLEGHSYTYEGSSWGKIVQILIDSKCMNPVIYFDELDKVSDTPRGEEIIGILTHLTDTSQNSQYHDKYFAELDFDLSKCLFIFSYNDESKVNPILRDRMYRINTKGYEPKEKIVIARDYLLPKIREQVNFKEEDIIIPDETIQYIVSNDSLTNQEAGVRNLKRCLEIIYTKINLFRLMRPESNIFGKDIDIKVTFPFTVTKKEVDIFIKSEGVNQSMLAMYV